ncbi:hypothetical protein Salat_1128700 [Sesamum alatum]|uniref:Uncharacterized protein n=1 Tax=Sesamum alatum TaxID=300844 RepID=A0AAE1YDI9_9LAMI|nr:hypothetical protein Salat_1128700 [Sesamum alatum]
MFSEDQQPIPQQDQDVAVRQKGSRSGNYLKEKPSTNDTDETVAEAIQQNYSQEIVEDSEDDFNYDDPIIAELLDKDWDKELANLRRSPNDKAAHFDIASTKTGTVGDILETHKEATNILYKGDTSTYQITETQEIEVASKGEEETTPIYNRFQSLQNLEEKEIQVPDQHNQSNTAGNIEANGAGDTNQNTKDYQPPTAQREEDNSYEEQIPGRLPYTGFT